jgi:hypothetical protein
VPVQDGDGDEPAGPEEQLRAEVRLGDDQVDPRPPAAEGGIVEPADEAIDHLRSHAHAAGLGAHGEADDPEAARAELVDQEADDPALGQGDETDAPAGTPGQVDLVLGPGAIGAGPLDRGDLGQVAGAHPAEVHGQPGGVLAEGDARGCVDRDPGVGAGAHEPERDARDLEGLADVERVRHAHRWPSPSLWRSR